MKSINEKLYKAFNAFLENEGGYVIFAIAVVAIILATVGFYGTHGFDWKWFLFFHLPLYIFCCWALWKTMKTYRQTLDNINKRKKEHES